MIVPHKVGEKQEFKGGDIMSKGDKPSAPKPQVKKPSQEKPKKDKKNYN